MKRWHITLGLTGAAIGAALLAPRLSAFLAPPAPPEIAEIPPVVHVVPPPPPVVQEEPQGPLIVDAGLDRSAVLKGAGSERFLTVTVRAPAVEGEAVRQPVNLAVVMDASGSMSAAGKIDYAKGAAKHLVQQMERGDSYSLVTFNDDATVVVGASDVSDPKRVMRRIDQVYEGGGTNLFAGMSHGDKQIRSALDSGEVGRMVILSDGKANVGVTDPDSLARFAAEAASRGVSVSAIGLGVDYNEDLLARISDLGGGTYAFIDDPRELESVFSEELARSASLVARDTRVNIQFPAGVEPLEVIGWDAQRIDGGWSVFMGDVSAGSERKIVARVRIVGTELGDLEVADVRADYHDLLGDALATSRDSATARVTVDPNEVAQSLDSTRAAAAQRAWGNSYLDRSTRAYEKGDTKNAADLLRQGSGVLKKAAASTGDSKLAEDAKALDDQIRIIQGAKSSSREGRRAIKMNKELFREAAR